MSFLLICFLIQVVSVWSQSTLVDSQCDYECKNDVEIRRMVAMIESMERILKDTNERSERKIMELESKLDSQKTSFDNRIQELDQKVKTQKDTIDQLETKVSELESMIQMTNVESSTTSDVGTTPNVIETTTQNVIESIRREDCDDIRALGYQTSGVYGVNPGNGLIKYVYCEISADGGAWTRILHRQDNLTDFTFKKWADYEAGFGDPQGSHWMGLVLMQQLTTSQDYKLRVDLMDWEGEMAYAEYSTVRVGPGSDKYRLVFGSYRGTAGDSMTQFHNNTLFSTVDQVNGQSRSGHCVGPRDPNGRTGGWWYDTCYYARLTGEYLNGGERITYLHGIVWPSWRSWNYSYKVATMKIQRL